ncbi:sulfotransferase domain-containing protein [Radiobacillus sp. PE A8.2]|uniref:sulfotransferase domain-containing protein n=1 Tax=Radiobacillus sp. PE A8.2 TaxID=3380349 RepID=UPI00388E9FA7
MENAVIPKVFINSVPKSGTNLLVQIIQGIPGIERVEESALLDLQSGQFTTGHLHYNEELSKQLHSKSIKQLFIYRDLRDVTVSLRHFINDKFQDHPLYKVFQNRLVTKEQQLNALIAGTELIGEEKNNKWGLMSYPGVYEEFKNIYEWQEDPSIYSMRYEDLMEGENKRDEVILKAIQFLGEESELKMGQQQLLTLMTQNIHPEKSWTFRKGTCGGWREEFSKSNIETFKSIAGNLLIQLDYEKGDEW